MKGDRTLQECEATRSEFAIPRRRDSQRLKVYRAEDHAINIIEMCLPKRKQDVRFRSYGAIEDFVNSTRKTNLMKSFNADLPHQEIFVRRPRSLNLKSALCHCFSSYSVIELPDNPWAKRQFTVLHELAHHCSKPLDGKGRPDHGGLFVSRFLSLVDEFVSIEASEIFYSSFLLANVNTVDDVHK